MTALAPGRPQLERVKVTSKFMHEHYLKEHHALAAIPASGDAHLPTARRASKHIDARLAELAAVAATLERSLAAHSEGRSMSPVATTRRPSSCSTGALAASRRPSCLGSTSSHAVAPPAMPDMPSRKPSFGPACASEPDDARPFGRI